MNDVIVFIFNEVLAQQENMNFHWRNMKIDSLVETRRNYSEALATFELNLSHFAISIDFQGHNFWTISSSS